MKLSKVLVLALCGFLALGCEKKEEHKETKLPATSEKSVAKKGPLKLTNIKAIASQTTLQLEGSPKPKEVEAWLKSALYATDNFSESAPRVASARITYDIRKAESKAGKSVVDVVFFGEVKEPSPAGAELPNRFKFDVRLTDAMFPGSSASDLIKQATERFAKAIAGQITVSVASPEELVEIIQSGENKEAQLMAVRRARESRLPEATSVIRPLLDSDDKDLKGAAAAALVANGDAESYSAIIKIAEDFSRERNPQMMGIVYLIGEMKTEESKVYLETLAEGHAAEPIREAAKKALMRTGAEK